MTGTSLLLFSILGSALPVIIAFFWLKFYKSAVTLPWFLASLISGLVSFVIAALIQEFFIPFKFAYSRNLFSGIFIRIALVEEASRLITLAPFLKAEKKQGDVASYAAFYATLGLVAGLGFAMLESAFHGISDLGNTALRAISAAPLHGACGIRVGAALAHASIKPVKSIRLFFSAVLIHGAYNLIIVSPVIPSPFAILVALSALFSAFFYIKN